MSERVSGFRHIVVSRHKHTPEQNTLIKSITMETNRRNKEDSNNKLRQKLNR